MKPYLLLTPGPLTTSETVKEAMMTDWCTWDADYNVHIVEEIRKSLVALATTATNTLPYSCREAVLIAWKLLSAVSSLPSTNYLSSAMALMVTAWATLPSITASTTICLLSKKPNRFPLTM